MKNLMVLVTVMLTWFCFGFAIAFGTNNRATDIQFAGFMHGYFGDFSGGLQINPNTTTAFDITSATSDVTRNEFVPTEVYELQVAFQQRKFFVFFCFMILASNIATSSFSERSHLLPIAGFVVLQNLFITPLALCCSYARPLFGSNDAQGGVGFLYKFGFFDRSGAIPILFGGALSGLVATAVLGPRYGIFMPIDDQQKISGGGKEERQKGIMTILQTERDRAFEIDELYLYKIRKIIKRELTHGNIESGIDLPKMVFGTFIYTICLCMMNSLGLNSQFDLFTQQARYNATFGFINPILSGSASALVSYIIKRLLIKTNSGNHLFDMKVLCNGFLAGVVGVSVGSGGMQPYMAVLAGLATGPIYTLGVVIFRQFNIDDPMENCQIYIMPICWSAVNAVIFQDSTGMMVNKMENLDSLGTELLGLGLIAILVLAISLLYFFPMKRLGKLRVPKAIEVIGRDTVMNAQSKGLDIELVIEKIENLYPEPKKRGC
jgi:ammonia channel protein AmtB